MSADVVERVLRSARYRDVDPGLVRRLADEELPGARTTDEAVKRVKRRLHQAVGAFRGPRMRGGQGVVMAWHGDFAAPTLRAACLDAMAGHASTRERAPYLDAFYRELWRRTGVPDTLVDLGCGLNPLALPWMDIGRATYHACDVDERPLGIVRGFLGAVGQPGRVEHRDLVVDPPRESADVALLLKLVTTLDRQDPSAAARLLRAIDVRHAVVSFATRSLGGRSRGMERTYRERLDRLVADVGRVETVSEASVPHELVFVLTLGPMRA
jgi:16S rRNA (guanine(1405)-N(7))-methyltransferase